MAAPEIEVRLIDSQGRDADEGELLVRCPYVCLGYYNEPEITRQKLHDGWLHTGDVVERRGDVYVVHGRVGDRINRGGYKFDPIDVEDVALVEREVGMLGEVRPRQRVAVQVVERDDLVRIDQAPPERRRDEARAARDEDPLALQRHPGECS